MCNIIKKIKINLLYLLPKQIITQLAGILANQRIKFLTKLMIQIFIKIYKINLSEVKENDILKYDTFNSFFTRQLKDGARPIIKGDDKLICPVDGKISQLGKIVNDQILQTKGHCYSLISLLAGNNLLSDKFSNGLFINTYLSPSDYHRIHIPCDSLLSEMIYVPGSLFSVNKCTTKIIPNLFARNERIICIFKTNFGIMAQILIGAIIVGSIDTTWCDSINYVREGIIKRWVYPKKNDINSVFLKKGEEMGKFKIGSTVINLFESNSIKLNSLLKKGTIIKVGELLGESINSNMNK